MPDHPEREIEKQLRASAEQRRAEAGAAFELHEATRRALQAEVARQYGNGNGESARSHAWWSMLWPRLAIVAPVAALVVAGFVWISAPRVPQEASRPLVVADAKDRVEAAKSSAQPTETLAAPKLAVAEDKADQPVVRRFAVESGQATQKKAQADFDVTKTEAQPPPATVPATPTATTPDAFRPTPTITQVPEVASARDAVGPTEASSQNGLGLRGGGGFGGGGGGGRGGRGGGGFGGGRGGAPATVRAQELADATQPARKADGGGVTLQRSDGAAATQQFARAPNLALAPATASYGMRQNETANTWFFKNVAVAADEREEGTTGRPQRALARPASAPANIVLDSFRFELTGNQLRIVEKDGSVYLGQTQPPGSEALLKAKEPSVLQSTPESRGLGGRYAGTANQASTQSQTIPLNFRVTGTNRSLSQQVVFTGQLQQVVYLGAVTNQFGVPQGNTKAVETERQASAAFMQSQLLSNSNSLPQQRIVGRARLQDSREQTVDAITTPPSW